VHRKFVISGDVEVLRRLAGELEPMAAVVRISLDETACRKPPGGVLHVQALNRSSDEVLRLIQRDTQQGKVVVEISESTSIIDVTRQELIHHDYDEMLWEEMEQNLRNQARISGNSLVLMALGGIITAAAIGAPPSMQVIAVVAASIIAPGFDGIAGVSLGLVLKRWKVVGRAATASLTSYSIAIASAGITFVALRAAGAGGRGLEDRTVVELLTVHPATLVISAASAAAGGLMIVSLRDIYVVGPLMALVLIAAASFLGCALATGSWAVAALALRRLCIDASFVVAVSAVVFWLKQRTVHKRRPLD
jgi:hypothetical protein